MKSEIEKLKGRIEKWDATLEDEASWLFVGTLSVWSVTQIYFQLIASLILFFLFVTRLQKASGIKNEKGFDQEIIDLEKTIKDSECRESITDLKSRNSFLAHFMNAKVYFLSFLFWLLATLYFFIDHFEPF